MDSIKKKRCIILSVKPGFENLVSYDSLLAIRDDILEQLTETNVIAIPSYIDYEISEGFYDIEMDD